MRNSFGTYHPALCFGYFCVVIGIGMLMIHPVFLILGVSGAFIYSVITGGRGSVKFALCFLLPATIVISAINPLVNHRGMTILFYTKYSYITLEACLYGMLLGLMISTVLLWFSSYNKVMTTDKFVYLFGRIMPAGSLIFSMVMRFVPEYKAQIQKTALAQQGIGMNVTNGTKKEKARHGLRIISVMFTWAVEGSITTADSMTARGYGLKKRTAFSIFRFDSRDMMAALFLISMVAVVMAGIISGSCHMDFFPEIGYAKNAAVNKLLRQAAYTAFALICYFPGFIEIKEALKWRRIQKNMD